MKKLVSTNIKKFQKQIFAVSPIRNRPFKILVNSVAGHITAPISKVVVSPIRYRPFKILLSSVSGEITAPIS